MFSANHKISTRQIKYLLLMEWIAKPCILLPVCLEKKSLGSVIFCVAFGIVFWAAAVTVLFRWIRPGEDLFGAVTRVLGVWPARILYGIGGLYFLAQAAVFLNLTAELAGQYLLPEAPLPMLCFLPLLCGIYLGGSGIEVRGRFCEVTGPVVLGLMVLAAVLSVFGIDGQLTEETLVRGSDGLTTGAFEVFACLGGPFVPLAGNSFQDIGKNSCLTSVKAVNGHENPGKKAGVTTEPWKAARRAGILAGLTGGSLCAIAVASYGKNGIGELEFPVVRVMSNGKIPGDFLLRWDILFLALLLTAMLVTVAGSFWYMREIVFRLLEERQQLAYRLWGGGIVLSYLMAAGFLSAFTAICYYRAWNMQVLMPVLLFSYLLLGIRRKVKAQERVTGDEKHRSWEKRISAEEGKDNTSKRYKRAGKVLVLVCVAAAVSVYLSGLTLEKAAQNSSGEIGTYPEQLYKNNAEYRESSTTLGRIIAEYFA